MTWLLVDGSWSMEPYLSVLHEAMTMADSTRRFVFRTSIEPMGLFDETIDIYGRSAVWDCFAEFANELCKHDPGVLIVITDGDDTGSTRESQGTCRSHRRSLEKLGWKLFFPVFKI
jgi:hypothetical protein